jgi:tRNA-guanine family transglycosylase
MPVGSRGVVRLLSAQDLDDLGVQVVLANTYHLMLRPGAEVVAAMGGLHGFTGWDGHFLTDSGGYQVMSLPCSVDDDGVTFRSSYDGSWQRLTPERRLYRTAGAQGGRYGGGGADTGLGPTCPPGPLPARAAAFRHIPGRHRA